MKCAESELRVLNVNKGTVLSVSAKPFVLQGIWTHASLCTCLCSALGWFLPVFAQCCLNGLLDDNKPAYPILG